MEPWGTPGLAFVHIENCTLRTTSFLSFKKSRKKFSKRPDIPFALVWKWYHHPTPYQMR